MADAHEIDGHGDIPGSHDIAGHGDMAGHGSGETGPLGPLDARAWGAGILGVLTGGLVAVLLYLATYH